MKYLFLAFLAIAVCSSASACGDDDDGAGDMDSDTDADTDSDSDTDADTDSDSDTDADTDSDSDTDADTDSDSDTDIDTDADSDTDSDQGLSSACECEGGGCESMGVPVPNGGTVIGCEVVPTDIPGAELVCLRSYDGNLGTSTYFANGFCALMSSNCTGDNTICDNAVFGDFDAMTTCPSGSVMVVATQEVSVLLWNATITNKNCTRACDGDDAQCRAGEYDPILDEDSQYQCIDDDGVLFCNDPRNLPDPSEYESTQF